MNLKEIDVEGVVLPNVPLSNIQLIDAAKTHCRCGMKMCPAWSAVRNTSNINIGGTAALTFVARTDYYTTYV